MTKALICALLLMFSLSVHAQNSSPPEQIEQFSRAMSSGQSFENALDQLFSQNIKSNFMTFDVAKWKELLITDGKSKMARLGKHLGMELIKEEPYSPSFKRMVYMQKFENAPVFWEFYFYKPKDAWLIRKIDINHDPTKYIY